MAPFVGASPVGTAVADWGWSAGLAALGASSATRAKRGQLLAVALVAAAGAQSGASVVFAAVAVVCGALSTRRLDRRAVLNRGLSGGATVISLLAGAGDVPAWQVAGSAVIVVAVLGSSTWRNSSARHRRRLAWGLGTVAGLWVGASALAGLAVAANAGRLETGSSELRLGLSAARLGQVDDAAGHLENARSAMVKAKEDVERYGLPARIFPVSAQHVSAVVDLLGPLERATDDARRAADVVAGDRLAVTTGTIDVDALAELEIPLTRLAASLGEVVDEVAAHGSDPLLPPLRERLDELGAESARAHRDAVLGAQAASALPDALGRSGERRYLVLFTSPAESRGRFGFPGSFAEVTMDDGRYLLGEHGSVSEAFNGVTFDQLRFAISDDRLRPYEEYGATRTFLSSTIPPDFRVVARDVAEMWAQSGRAPVDGVLRFDPRSLAPLLQFTGPVEVDGLDEPLTSANLVEYLLVGQYQQYQDAAEPRREVLDEVADVTFERLEISNLPKPRELFDHFAPLVRSGDLQAVAFDEAVADLLGEVRMDGRLDAPASDGFLVTTVNGLGNKIDSFLFTHLAYEGTVSGGRLDATLTIRLDNAAPAAGLPDYVIGSFRSPGPPRGTNRLMLLVSTAARIDGARLDGRPVPVRSGHSGGWYLHELQVEIPPGGSRTVELDVAGDLPEGPYQLLIEPGGGSEPDQVEVDLTVDGRSLTHQGRSEHRSVLR